MKDPVTERAVLAKAKQRELDGTPRWNMADVELVIDDYVRLASVEGEDVDLPKLELSFAELRVIRDALVTQVHEMDEHRVDNLDRGACCYLIERIVALLGLVNEPEDIDVA